MDQNIQLRSFYETFKISKKINHYVVCNAIFIGSDAFGSAN